jgi:tetratricopeptide (TPR) repeat protein
MSDIFISYASEDRNLCKALATTLENEGLSVFWDRKIPVGTTWRELLEEELISARCLIVLWSHSSVRSEWVKEEAEEGRVRGILIPVLIENVSPPVGFRTIQCAPLIGWDGNRLAPGYQQLIEDITALPAVKSGLKSEQIQKRSIRREESHRSAETLDQQLEIIRRNYDLPALNRLQESLGSLGELTQRERRALFEASRQLGDWGGVVYIYESLPIEEQQDVRLQLAVAQGYGRLGRFAEALKILEPLVNKSPSAVAFAALARIYKDKSQGEIAVDSAETQDLLRRSAEAYLQSFSLDPEAHYSALNAASLLARLGDADSIRRLNILLPRLKDLLTNEIEKAGKDYWRSASLLEVFVLSGDIASVQRVLADVVSLAEFPWQVATTRSNLEFLLAAPAQRGLGTGWMQEVIETLARWEREHD